MTKKLGDPYITSTTIQGFKLIFIATPETEGGYSIMCSEIPAAVSQGETIEDAVKNITDAVCLCLKYSE